MATKNVGDYEVAVGNPVKVIRTLDDKIIQQRLRIMKVCDVYGKQAV